MRVLIILSRFPYPLEKGDKLRAFHHIKSLSKEHELIVVCLSDREVSTSDREALLPYVKHLEVIRLSYWRIGLNLLRGCFDQKPFQIHYFYHKFAQKRIDTLIENFMPAHLFCQLIRTAEYARRYQLIPSTIDYMDAFSTGIKRRIGSSIPILKPIFQTEYERLKSYEKECFGLFDHHTIISEQDRDLIEHPKRSNIAILKNGVDTAYFHHASHEKKYDAVFVGNMSYPPNVQAAIYLATQIFPAVRKHKPHFELLLAGANPTARIKGLAQDGIHVSGWMNDIREAYWSSRVFIAPMQIGTGMQNKLLEAMACALPCITSSLALKAIQAEPDREVLLANSVEENVASLMQLLDDDKLHTQISTNGLSFVKAHYSWNTNAQILIKTLGILKNGTLVDK